MIKMKTEQWITISIEQLIKSADSLRTHKKFGCYRSLPILRKQIMEDIDRLLFWGDVALNQQQTDITIAVWDYLEHSTPDNWRAILESYFAE